MYNLLTNHLSDVQLSLLFGFLIIAISAILLARVFFRKKIKELPLASLQKKLSNGEIDSYEFERCKRQLQKEEDLKLRSFFISHI